MPVESETRDAAFSDGFSLSKATERVTEPPALVLDVEKEGTALRDASTIGPGMSVLDEPGSTFGMPVESETRDAALQGRNKEAGDHGSWPSRRDARSELLSLSWRASDPPAHIRHTSQPRGQDMDGQARLVPNSASPHRNARLVAPPGLLTTGELGRSGGWSGARWGASEFVAPRYGRRVPGPRCEGRAWQGDPRARAKARPACGRACGGLAACAGVHPSQRVHGRRRGNGGGGGGAPINPADTVGEATAAHLHRVHCLGPSSTTATATPAIATAPTPAHCH